MPSCNLQVAMLITNWYILLVLYIYMAYPPAKSVPLALSTSKLLSLHIRTYRDELER